MADCASLLDEELSSFVFSYLTENSDSQVRCGSLWTHFTLGFPDRGASGSVAGRGACYARLMRGFRRLVSSISPAQGEPVSRIACVRACVRVYMCVSVNVYGLTCSFHEFLDEMSSAMSNEGI